VQIFDRTDQDNRHIDRRDLKPGQWQTLYLDFTKEAQRNDGRNTLSRPGHTVDDLFFFVEPDGAEPVDLLIDEVVLTPVRTTRGHPVRFGLRERQWGGSSANGPRTVRRVKADETSAVRRADILSA
jgi:hypothetical protein